MRNLNDYTGYPITIRYRILTRRLDVFRSGKLKNFKEIVKYILYQDSMFSRITNDDRVDHVIGCFEIAKVLSKNTEDQREVLRLIHNILYKNKGYSTVSIASALTKEAFRLKAI